MTSVLFAIACLAAMCGANTGFSAWKDSARIYFNTTSTGAALSAAVKDFPLLVRLDTNNFKFGSAPKSPADIRFSDPDGTELQSQVSRWDPDFYHAAEIWVRVPQVDANSSTDYITMHWNNPSPPSASDDPLGNTSPFDTVNGFVGVWHLDEIAAGVGGKGVFLDASKLQNAGDDQDSDPSEAGAVGRAQHFNGLTDYISVPNSASLNLDGPMTISAWIKAASYLGLGPGANLSQVNPIVRKGEANPNSYQLSVASGHLTLALDSNDNGGVRSVQALETRKWIHVAGVWDGKTVQLYVDGKLDVDKAPPKAVAMKKDARPILIGGRPTSPTDPNSLDLFTGDLDEVQVSRVVRSKDWIRLAYENQKPGSAMLTFKTVSAAPVGGGKEDLTLWKHSAKLFLDNTAQGAGVTGSVENFPLLVRLTSATFPFSQAQAGGKDIRFADADGTPLAYAVERWDAALSKAELWVKVPKVDGGGKTDFITLFWGNADAADAQKTASVFDTADGFAGVWHLNQGASGTGALAVYKDASGAGNHGDDFAALNPSEALIGVGQQFGGSSDQVRIPNSPSLAPTEALSISAWIKGSSYDTSASHVNPILRKGTVNPSNYQFMVNRGVLSLTLDGNDGYSIDGKTKLKPDVWHHVAATWAKGRVRIYLDGAADLDVAGKAVSIMTDTRPLYIGGRDPDGIPGDQFDGWIDEVQFSRVERGPDWIKLAYQNQRPDSKLIVFENPKVSLPVDTTKTDTVAVKPVPVDTAKINPDDVVLNPGQQTIRNGLLKVANPADAAGPVHVRFLRNVDMGARGVSNAAEVISIQPGAASSAMPPVQMEMNIGGTGNQSLFFVTAGKDGKGVVRNMGAGVGSWVLGDSGEYFLGRDTVTPVLTVAGSGITADDSSWIEVLPADNVENLSLSVSVTGSDGVAEFSRGVKAGQSARFAFKAGKDLSALGVSFRLTDGSLAGAFPAARIKDYPLMRGFKDVHAPIELKKGMDWKLAGIPLLADSSLRMRDMVDGGDVFGAVWLNHRSGEATRGEYRILRGDDTLPFGRGLWLASNTQVGTLKIGNARSRAPGAGGIFRIDLIKGWNQITCPALESLPWPISHADTVREDKSTVKGLQGIDAATGGYRDVDSLVPWKGYFVYSRKDTAVDLAVAAPVPSAKRSANAFVAQSAAPAMEATGAGGSVPVQILLEPLTSGPEGTGGAGTAGLSSTVRLGAATYAGDSVGVEDAPMAPPPRGRAELSAVRSGQSLKSDLVGYRMGAAFAWKVAWSAEDGRPPLVGRLRVRAVRLPPGLTLWVASPLRKVAEPADAGGILEVLGDGSDTLIVWAGPADWKGGSPIPGLGPKPRNRAVSWLPASGILHIALPSITGVTASFWDLSGKRLASLQRPGLAAGYYDFPIPECRKMPRLLVVTVEFTGDGGNGRLVFKTAAP